MLAVILIGGSAAAWFLQRDDSAAPRGAGSACPTPSATASPPPLPAPAQVRLALLNGTSRNQLAEQVGAALAGRGFVVLSKGNAPAAVAGPSVISYGPGALPAATVLARHVAGSRVEPAKGRPAPASVQLVLGGDFRRLATPAEVVAAAAAGTGQSVVPVPTQTPCSA